MTGKEGQNLYPEPAFQNLVQLKKKKKKKHLIQWEVNCYPQIQGTTFS